MQTVERLHACWSGRVPVVVELAVDPSRFRAPQTTDAPPYAISPGLELPFDRLHHLVWANNYDARGEQPVWWWAAKAVRVGASEGGAADVVLPDGRDGLDRRRSALERPAAPRARRRLRLGRRR